MPDPLPSVTSSSLSLSTAIFGSRITGRSGPAKISSLTSSSGSVSSTLNLSSSEETPHRSHLWPGGTLTRLYAPRSMYNFKDDMEDDTKSFTESGSTPPPSSKSEEASITPPEAWGGEKISDKFNPLRQLPSHFGMQASGGLTSGSVYFGQEQSSTLSQTSISSLTSSNLSYENLRTQDVSSNPETSLGFPEHVSSGSMSSLSLGSKGIIGAGNLDSPKLGSLALPRRFSTYTERISTTSAFSDGTSHLVGSSKTKKTGAETRKELLNSLLSRSDSFAAVESGILSAMNI